MVAGVEGDGCSAGGRARGLRTARSRDRDQGWRESEQPRQGDLRRGCTVRLGNAQQRRVAHQAADAARPSQRGVGDHDDSRAGAVLDEASAECGVVERVERDLHRGDRGDVERLVQLATVDVGQPDVPHQAVLEETAQRAHRGRPGRARIRCMDEVEVDAQAVQGDEAGLAVAGDRAGAAVRDPSAAGPRHATLGDDAGGCRGAAAAQSAGQQRLVVAEVGSSVTVGARGVEDGHARVGGGRDRGQGTVLIAAGIGGQAHAAQPDAELGGAQPARRDCRARRRPRRSHT